MANSFFHFKQFIVHQPHCAMKVTIDACIQGAWTPVSAGSTRAVDIGCGTGLLSLMLAQRFPQLRIDAIELLPECALQAVENVAASPFQDRISLIGGDAKKQNWKQDYDLLICNPPFFSHALAGPDAARNTARHSTTLDATALPDIIERCLAPGGTASVMLPLQEHELRSSLMLQRGWHPQRLLYCYSNAQRKTTRVVSLWGRATVDCEPEALTLYDADHELTPDAAALLRDFYLFL